MLLAASIALLVWALLESSKAGDIRGPGALVVAGDEVWIAVDAELWRVTPHGHLKRRDVLAALGVPGAPANLVRHPSGAIVATVRDDPTLYFLDSASAQVTRKLQPAWPAELSRHAGRSINLAFHQDGRLAIATGGGHTVALFDANGAFVARTSPDLYNFTNGLWWQGDELWTTDTNRFFLKRLDGATLALREEQALPGRAGAVFLGPARAYVGPDGATRAALIRFRNGMIVGRVVAIGADGREAEFKHAAAMEPNDIDWLRGELLASDGAAMTVWRWSAAREPLGAFGDDELRSEWSKLRQQQLALQAHHRIGLNLAIGTFVIGFALAVWAELRGRRPAPHVARPLPEAAPRKRRSNVSAAAASALIPGLGQWMQRRRTIALAMFVPWAVAVVTSFIPLGWILAGPRMEVSARTVLGTVAVALGYAAFCAWEAWRVDGRRPDA